MGTVETSSVIRGTEISIPTIQVHDGAFVFGFFRELFENSELEEVTDRYKNIMPYQRELVIPRSTTKGLVVLRGGYDVIDPATTEHSIGWDEWKTVGQKYIKVLTEPEQTGSFVEKLSVTNPRLTGHGSSYPDERIDYPERPFENGDWEGRWERVKEWKLSILQNVVELIS